MMVVRCEGQERGLFLMHIKSIGEGLDEVLDEVLYNANGFAPV